jgi:hypothetical protein
LGVGGEPLGKPIVCSLYLQVSRTHSLRAGLTSPAGTSINSYIFHAANYLNIKSLQDLTCQTLAKMVKGKMPEDIHKMFNIKNDFTPEEAEEVHQETQWLFE